MTVNQSFVCKFPLFFPLFTNFLLFLNFGKGGGALPRRLYWEALPEYATNQNLPVEVLFVLVLLSRSAILMNPDESKSEKNAGGVFSEKGKFILFSLLVID